MCRRGEKQITSRVSWFLRDDRFYDRFLVSTVKPTLSEPEELNRSTERRPIRRG